MSTPEYHSPFSEQVSPRPSVTEMINIVVHQGLRPQIPEPLTLFSPRIVIETELMHDVWLFISDLWESEPEGRTTAACTADRFRETLRKAMQRNSRK
uniref:Uncharacterized protein n=1 Tax=Heterorhabditis bacteriophora TaxID=37862 RepID=A0A1I7X7C1_HETBA